VHFASVQNWERNWERNLSVPMPSQIPAIIRFLGFVPFNHDGSLAGKLRWLRIAAGWTQDDWAKAANISPGTIGRWEGGRGMRGSPVITIAVNKLATHLALARLSTFVASEVGLLQTEDFRRPRKLCSSP
jgi:DNA-binding XRE family transcriptional regulator